MSRNLREWLGGMVAGAVLFAVVFGPAVLLGRI